MKGRLARSGAALIAGTLIGGSGVAVSSAHAATLPADPAAHGYVGLCNGQGQNVTSGWVDSTPFAWKAVGSQAAPDQFRGPGQNAILRIYQPRPDATPTYWSGDALSAQSYYKGSTPSVQFTRKDIPLSVIVKEFPPEVDGMYQLRLYYNTPKEGFDPSEYAATTIQVSGDAWHVVSGGSVNCGAAHAVSQEAAAGAATGDATEPPPAPKSTPPGGSGQAGSGSEGGANGAGGTSTSGPGSTTGTRSTASGSTGTAASKAGSNAGAPAAGASTSPAADESSSSSGASELGWVFGVIGLALLLAAGGGYVYRRRGRAAERS